MSSRAIVPAEKALVDFVPLIPLAKSVGGASAKDESVFVFPATLSQQRIWFLDKLRPQNACLEIELLGTIDENGLREALNSLVRRHEILRTTFASEHGRLRQVIAPELALDVSVRQAEDAGAFEKLRAEETARRFDLEGGPLIRATLVRRGTKRDALLLTLHATITDDWSNEILRQDLRAFHSGESLVDPPLQFADYAEWQNEQLARGNFSAQRNYWREQLAGNFSELKLPRDRTPDAKAAVSRARRSRSLNGDVVRCAKIFAADGGADSFLLFLVVFETILHRYSGQADFLVVVQNEKREREEFARICGPFANPFLFRANLESDPSFVDLLGRSAVTGRNAKANQDIPFEALLDEFGAPNLQVCFHYGSNEGAETSGNFLELNARVIDGGESVRLEIEYDATLYDSITIERMLGHYETLLAGALDNPATPVSRLPLLGEEERALFCRTEEKSGESKIDFRRLLTERVTARVDTMLARHGRRELSYAELLARLEKEDLAENSLTDLDRLANWIEHWRARLDTPPPRAPIRSEKIHAVVWAAAQALHESAHLQERERVASFSAAGLAATEEIGAALLANAMLVYPSTNLLDEQPSSLAAWLESENISVACLPASAWNRFAAAIAAGKAKRPPKLRLAIATGSESAEKNFVRVVSRIVLDEIGGSVALDDKMLMPATARVRVLNPKSHEPTPANIVGKLFLDGAATEERARWRSSGALELIHNSFESKNSAPKKDEEVRPFLGLQLQMIAIWEELLGIRGIGIHDNFFALGGNWLLALRMVQRAEAACGQSILPGDFFREPTVENLANEIARETADNTPTLLRVNDAGSRTPFFYLHGDLFGGGFYSLKLSHALGADQPFFVLPPHDVRVVASAPSIEEMAAAHFTALRTARPKGPYVIGGFCLGGIVAYELAQQILASGEEVKMLQVIDAAPRDKMLSLLRGLTNRLGAWLGWDDLEKIAAFGRLALRRAQFAMWYESNVQTQTRMAIRQIYHRLISAFKIFRGTKTQNELPLENADAMREADVPAAFLWAAAGYRPRPYRGAMTLLLSEDLFGVRNLERAWRRFVPRLQVHGLPGSHLECITQHVETLAQTMAKNLT